MRSFRVFFFTSAIASFLFLASCSLPTPQPHSPIQTEGQAHFYLDRASAKFIETRTFDKMDLPAAKTISFSACVKDRKTNRPIQSQTFEIGGENGKAVTTKSDRAGCMNWNEELEFSIFKKAHNLLLKREIRNRGRFNGSAGIHFSVNPWNNTAYSEIDTKFSDKGLKPIAVTALSELEDAAYLKVYPLRSLFTIQEVTQTLATYKLDFMGQLALENLDHRNQAFEIDIKRATLKSRITILNRRKNGEYYLIHRTDWSKPTELKDSLINISTVYQSNSSACKNGRIEVAVELDVSESIKGLKPFEMIYQGPSCQANGFILMVANGDFQAQLRNGKIPNLQHYLEANVTAHAVQADTQAGNVTYLRPLTFDPSQVSGVGFERSKVVKVSTCLTSVVDTDAFRREDLLIRTTSGETQRVTTDDLGCFSWNERFAFNYFAGQCWNERTVGVSATQTNVSFNVNIGFSEIGHSDLYRDMRYFTIPKEQGCDSEQDLRSEVYLESFSIEKETYHYEIDDFLNISMIKKSLFKATPFLRRTSLIDPSGLEHDDLPPGQYRLRFALVETNQTDWTQFDGSQVHAYVDQEITLRAGSIISESIEIKTSDLKAMGNTNQAFISIEPIGAKDHLKNLRTRVFTGPVIPYNIFESPGLKFAEDPQILDRIYAAYSQHKKDYQKALAKISTKEIFAKESALTVLNLNKKNTQLGFRSAITNPKIYASHFKQPPVPEKILAEALSDPESLSRIAHHLCQFWIGDHGVREIPGKGFSLFDSRNPLKLRSLVRECQKMAMTNFGEVFDVERRTFIQKPKVVGMEYPQFRDITVTQNFSQNRSVSDTKASSVGWDVGGNLRVPEGIPVLSLINASTGLKFVVNQTWSNAENQNTFEAVTSGIVLQSETLRLRIQAEQAERCFVLRLNPALFMNRPSNGDHGISSFFSVDTPSPWFRLLNPKMTLEEKAFYAQSGFLVCEGEAIESRPVELVETYGIFNQRIYQGQMLDPASRLTRPFFSAVRGERDYLKFVGTIASTLKIPDGFKGDFTRAGFREDDFRYLFEKGLPGHPGSSAAPISIIDP